MAMEFWARLASTWRNATEVWFRSGGAWHRATEVWFRKAGAWHQVYQTPIPTLGSVTFLVVGEPQTGDLRVSWGITGSATGWTLTIKSKFTGDLYDLRYTGANGGSNPQTVPYWGVNANDPAATGQRMDTDAWALVELKDGSGNHANGSPVEGGPGFST